MVRNLKKKVCQYCFKEFDKDKYCKTGEHIIPKGIIELFPDQYISFTKDKDFVDNDGIKISDVCGYCNNILLSALDSYGKDLIKTQFLEKISGKQLENTFNKKFDYHKLSRWLLKIIFNERRSQKLDCRWFNKAHGYMLNGLLVENFSFSLFAGVHINTTPLPEESYNYLPMQINNEPLLLGSSLGIVSFGLNPYDNSITVPMKMHTYCIRFGTAVFYCILWDEKVAQITKVSYNKLFETKFNFKRIISNQQEYSLKCISAHSNTSMGYNHLLSASGQEQDRLIIEGQLNGRSFTKAQQDFLSSWSLEEMNKGRVLVESAEFPENKRIKRNYEKIFGSK